MYVVQEGEDVLNDGSPFHGEQTVEALSNHDSSSRVYQREEVHAGVQLLGVSPEHCGGEVDQHVDVGPSPVSIQVRSQKVCICIISQNIAIDFCLVLQPDEVHVGEQAGVSPKDYGREADRQQGKVHGRSPDSQPDDVLPIDCTNNGNFTGWGQSPGPNKSRDKAPELASKSHYGLEAIRQVHSKKVCSN